MPLTRGFFMMKQAFLFGFLALLATPVFAQPYDYQAAQGGYNSGQLSAEIARLEEQIRQIRGENEKLRHQISQMQDAQRRFQEDMEFRMGGNNGGSMTPPPPPPPSAPIASPPPMPAPSAPFTPPEMGSITVPPAPNAGFETSPDPQTLRVPSEDISSPRDLYNHAFRLLNQSDYAGAEQAFAKFTTEFPSDPLIGNAWYWLGETFYVRREYVRAADAFRQGFEALEDGPKAGDNLLKLAMSLAAMEKDQEACVVLKQVDSKYSSNSKSLKAKVAQESSRLGC